MAHGGHGCRALNYCDPEEGGVPELGGIWIRLRCGDQANPKGTEKVGVYLGMLEPPGAANYRETGSRQAARRAGELWSNPHAGWIGRGAGAMLPP